VLGWNASGYKGKRKRVLSERRKSTMAQQAAARRPPPLYSDQAQGGCDFRPQRAVFAWCTDSLAADDTNMVTKTKDYLKVHSGKDEERYPEGVLPGGFDRLSPSKKIRHLRRSMRWWLEHARENMISEATLLKIVKHFWMAEIKENPTWHDAARVARSMEEFMDPLLTVLRSPEVFNDFEEHYTSSKQWKTQTVQVWIQKATELAAPLLGFVDEHDLVRKIVNNLHKDFQAAAPTLYEHLCDFARVDTQEAALTLQQKDAISLRALRETLDTRAHRAMIVTGEKAMGIDASKDDHEAEKKRSTRNRDRSPDGGKGGRSEKTDGKRGGARRRGKSDKGAAKEGNKGAKRERSDGDGRSDAAEKKAGTGNDRKKDVKCYNCQKKGHYAHECRAPKKQRPDEDARKDEDSRKDKDPRKGKDSRQKKEDSVEKARPAPTYSKEEVKKRRDEFRARNARIEREFEKAISEQDHDDFQKVFHSLMRNADDGGSYGAFRVAVQAGDELASLDEMVAPLSADGRKVELTEGERHCGVHGRQWQHVHRCRHGYRLHGQQCAVATARRDPRGAVRAALGCRQGHR
jgi:hypothetical protein